jgi:hypothetical protein
VNRRARVRDALVPACYSTRLDCLARKERGHVESAAGSSLTIGAVAERHQEGIARAFRPEWDERFYSFDRERDGTCLARMRNGEGDLWYLLFLPSGAAVLRGFDHNSVMSPYRHDDERLWLEASLGLRFVSIIAARPESRVAAHSWRPVAQERSAALWLERFHHGGRGAFRRRPAVPLLRRLDHRRWAKRAMSDRGGSSRWRDDRFGSRSDGSKFRHDGS